MRIRTLIPVFLVIAIILLPLSPVHALSLEIPANTVNQTYELNATLPVGYVITLKGLVANTSMDNIALSFRTSAYYEVLNIFIKTGGTIAVSSQVFNILPKEIGQWSDGTAIYVYFKTNSIEVYIGSPMGTPAFNYTVPSSYNLYDLRVHSNDDTNPAYTSGVISISDIPIIDFSGLSKTVEQLIPLLISIIPIAVPLMFIRAFFKPLESILD